MLQMLYLFYDLGLLSFKLNPIFESLLKKENLLESLLGHLVPGYILELGTGNRAGTGGLSGDFSGHSLLILSLCKPGTSVYLISANQKVASSSCLIYVLFV